jgi:hypothetical protein
MREALRQRLETALDIGIFPTPNNISSFIREIMENGTRGSEEGEERDLSPFAIAHSHHDHSCPITRLEETQEQASISFTPIHP